MYTFNLGDGGHAKITGIPRQMTYAVSETGVLVDGRADADALAANYTTNHTGSATGTIFNGTLVTVAYTNEYVTQSVTFAKQDAETHAGLNGAKFELRSGSTVIEAVSSDGTVTFQSVPVGTYDLWETQAPANYESVGSGKDTTIDVVVAKSGVTFQKPNAVARFFGNLLSGTDDSYSLTGNDLVIYNIHEKGQLTIAKVTTPDTLSGSYTFTVYDENKTALSDVEPITVSANGAASAALTLNTGTYYIKETASATQANYDPAGTTYNVGTADQDGYVRITVASGETTQVVCTNAYTLKTGTLTVEKAVDGKDTDEKFTIVVTLGTGAGGGQNVAAGETVEYRENGVYTFTLADDETASISGLPYTTEYTVEEQHEELFSYVVSGEVKEQKSFQGNCTETITNTYVTSGFVVNKVDNAGKLITSGTATFALYSKKPGSDGFNAETDRVQQQTTAGGVASFNGLAAGTYYLQETAAPTGYAKDDTVWTVTVTTSGGAIDPGEVSVTVEDGTNIIAKLWKSVLSFFSGETYTSESVPVSLSSDDHELSTAVLKMVNIPQVTQILKYATAFPYEEPGEYRYTPAAEYKNLPPDTTTVDTLFLVVIRGAPGASLEGYTDQAVNTESNDPLHLTLVDPQSVPDQIPASGEVDLFYQATLTPTTTATTYRNTASVAGKTASATVTVQKQEYPELEITINHWFQNEYGQYDKAEDYTLGTGLYAPDTVTIRYNERVYARQHYVTRSKYSVSTENPAQPVSILYTDAYCDEDNRTINIYYDMEMPKGSFRFDKSWDYGDPASPAENQQKIKSITVELQRTTDDPNDADAVWTAESTANMSYTSGPAAKGITWSSRPLYDAKTKLPYTYRVVETAINGVELQDGVRVLGYGPYDSDGTFNPVDVYTTPSDGRTAYATIYNRYEATVLPAADRNLASFTVTKYEDGTETPLADAEFTLTKQGDPSFTPVVKETGENGTITFDDLKDGVYTLSETNAPTNFAASTSTWTITVQKDAQVSEGPDENNEIHVYQDYSIADMTGSKDHDTQKDYVISEEPASITVYDQRLTTPETAGLTISKQVTTNDGVNVPDDTFTFLVTANGTAYTGTYTVGGETKTAGTDGSITLKHNETAIISGVKYGTVFVITESDKDGYTLTSAKLDGTDAENGMSVTIGEGTGEKATAAAVFTNHYNTNSFTIDKVDAENAMSRLNGAVFTLAGEKGTYTSETGSEKGELLFSNIPEGTYTLTETTAPADYEKTDTTWTVVITQNDVTITEKTDAAGLDQILAGIKTFFLGADWGSYDETHHILQVKNTHEKATISIGKNVTVEGSADNRGTYTFDITVKAGDTYTVVGSVEVNAATGEAVASKPLNTNKTYYLMEVNRAAGVAEEDYDLTVSYTDADGNTIEPNDHGYIPVTVGSGVENVLVNCTNAYTRKTGDLQITKIVEGLVGDEMSKEHSFTFQLTNDKYTDETYSIPVTVTGNGTVTIGDGDPAEDTSIKVKTGTYTVSEVSASIDKHSGPETVYAYTADGKHTEKLTVADGKTSTMTVTNTYAYITPPPEELDGSFQGTKIWDDANNQDGIRPESIWVQLFDENNEAVGDVVKVPVSERNERDAFTVAFDDYRYDAEELHVKEVGYTDAEGDHPFSQDLTAVEGYEAPVYTGSDTITNTHEPAAMEITVEKQWASSAEGLQRAVTLHLLANGKEIASVTLDGTVDETETTAWKASFGTQPVNADGKPIDYTITEDSLGSNWVYTVTENYKDGVDSFIVVNGYDDDDDDDDDDRDPSDPGTDIPDENTPTTDIPDENTPTTDIPDENTPTTDIPDEQTPTDEFADPTKTGDNVLAWVLAAAVSGVGLVWLAIVGKKRKDHDA